MRRRVSKEALSERGLVDNHTEQTNFTRRRVRIDIRTCHDKIVVRTGFLRFRAPFVFTTLTVDPLDELLSTGHSQFVIVIFPEGLLVLFTFPKHREPVCYKETFTAMVFLTHR